MKLGYNEQDNIIFSVVTKNEAVFFFSFKFTKHMFTVVNKGKNEFVRFLTVPYNRAGLYF
jgi:hypothetical protein